MSPAVHCSSESKIRKSRAEGELSSQLQQCSSPGKSPALLQVISGLGLELLVSQSVQLLSRVRLFATPWTAAHQASLSITNFWRLLKLKSIESVMPSNHLILCPPLLPSPSKGEERRQELLEAMHLREPRAINKANIYKALESQAGIKIAKRTSTTSDMQIIPL